MTPTAAFSVSGASMHVRGEGFPLPSPERRRDLRAGDCSVPRQVVRRLSRSCSGAGGKAAPRPCPLPFLMTGCRCPLRVRGATETSRNGAWPAWRVRQPVPPELSVRPSESGGPGGFSSLSSTTRKATASTAAMPAGKHARRARSFPCSWRKSSGHP